MNTCILTSSLNPLILAAEILFCSFSLILSLGIWALIINIPKFKIALNTAEKDILQYKQEVDVLEKSLKSPKIDWKKILLNPDVLFKILEIALLFQTKNLTKITILKKVLFKS